MDILHNIEIVLFFSIIHHNLFPTLPTYLDKVMIMYFRGHLKKYWHLKSKGLVQVKNHMYFWRTNYDRTPKKSPQVQCHAYVHLTFFCTEHGRSSLTLQK